MSLSSNPRRGGHDIVTSSCVNSSLNYPILFYPTPTPLGITSGFANPPQVITKAWSTPPQDPCHHLIKINVSIAPGFAIKRAYSLFFKTKKNFCEQTGNIFIQKKSAFINCAINYATKYGIGLRTDSRVDSKSACIYHWAVMPRSPEESR